LPLLPATAAGQPSTTHSQRLPYPHRCPLPSLLSRHSPSLLPHHPLLPLPSCNVGRLCCRSCCLSSSRDLAAPSACHHCFPPLQSQPNADVTASSAFSPAPHQQQPQHSLPSPAPMLPSSLVIVTASASCGFPPHQLPAAHAVAVLPCRNPCCCRLLLLPPLLSALAAHPRTTTDRRTLAADPLLLYNRNRDANFVALFLPSVAVVLLPQPPLPITLVLLPFFPLSTPPSRPLLFPISLCSNCCPSLSSLLPPTATHSPPMPQRCYCCYLLQRTSLDDLAASPQPASLITLLSLLPSISRSQPLPFILLLPLLPSTSTISNQLIRQIGDSCADNLVAAKSYYIYDANSCP
ncbi:hypothetical protein GW17_00061471, partial [Ensete ventricosum]